MRANPATVATHVVELARTGRFAEAEALFAKRLRKAVSAETFRVGWAGELAAIGSITAIGEPSTEPNEPGLVRVRVPVAAEHGNLDVFMSVDGAGKLHGLRLARATPTSWQPPPYADHTRFEEHDITLTPVSPVLPGPSNLSVESGPLPESAQFPVSGTLTLPVGPGPWPSAVLLSGGGPFDQDETSGVNKPLKDLAWGLASRGVAVVRFDHLTYDRPELAAAPGFTMSQEYLPSALAAVRLLQHQSTVDSERVFVVGHSMGGRVAPRVVAADATIAGMVILAGDATPMQHAAARVARHLALVSPATIPAAMLDRIDEQVAFIDGPDLSATTPAADLPFGLSGSYWLELRDDDPVGTAANLDKPVFIAQGARDYQVTVADDLARWQAGLAGRADVTITIYAADDHLFFPGDGPSTPAGYDPPQHVDPALVADIAEWLALPR